MHTRVSNEILPAFYRIVFIMPDTGLAPTGASDG